MQQSAPEEQDLLNNEDFSAEKPRKDLVPRGIRVLQWLLLIWSFMMWMASVYFVFKELGTINFSTVSTFVLFGICYYLALIVISPLLITGIILMMCSYRGAVAFSLPVFYICILISLIGFMVSLFAGELGAVFFYLIDLSITGIYTAHLRHIRHDWPLRLRIV